MLVPPRTSVSAPYTPCSLGWCGSCRFDVLEPPVLASLRHSMYMHCKDVFFNTKFMSEHKSVGVS